MLIYLLENKVWSKAEIVYTADLKWVSRYVVHSVATTAHQVRSINEFIKREVEAHPEFIGFITLHHDLAENEIIML